MARDQTSFALTVPIGQVQPVANALESRPAPNLSITHALPVNDILVLALPLHVGPKDKVVVHEVGAPLPTDDELVRPRPARLLITVRTLI